MAISDVTQTVADGALLGIVPVSASNTHVKMGVSAIGVAATIYSFSDIATLKKTLGYGPLVDAAALSLGIAGGPILCMPLNPSGAGTLSGVVKSGTGSGTVTVTAKNWTQILLKVITGGARGTFTFVVSLDGGLTYTPNNQAILSAATVVIPGAPQVTIAFTAVGGTDGVAGDLWTINTQGTASLTGTGTTVLTLSSASPTDAYSVIVTCVVAGNLGVGSFTYSLDGGNTTSGAVVIPSGGKYVLPNTGIMLTFGGTAFAVADTYTFTSTSCTYTNSDANAAFAVLLADTRQWFMVHIVGQAASVAASVTAFAAYQTQMATAATGYRYAFCLMECPQDTDANILSAATGFGNSADVRMAVAAGFAYTTSTVTGTVLSRSSAWHVAARLSAVVPSEAASFVGRNNLVGIPGTLASGNTPLSRDENSTQGLDAGRFCTLRTITGRSGFYITQARILCPFGSDFAYVELRRVMDIACNTSRQAFLPFLNSSVRIDGSTGFINEKDARRIENTVSGAIATSVVSPGYASSASVSVSRTTNLLSSGQLPATIRVVPLGYVRAISVDIGYLNPATKLS